MNAVDTNSIASVLMLLLSGFGLPMGVPPEPQDELLAKVAPEECLFYTSWAGMAEPDPNSSNQVEQLLAEPEVRQMMDSLEQQLKVALEQNAGGRVGQLMGRRRNQLTKLAQTVFTRPTAIFVQNVQMGPEGVDVQGGILIQVGDDVGEIVEFLEGIQAGVAGDEVERVQIAGGQFYRLQPAPEAPPITWGTRGKYLVLGVGDGSVEAMFERAGTAVPQWLADVKTQIRVDRVSTTTYVNVSKIRATVLPMAPPNVGVAVDALGLMEVDRLAVVTGLDEMGYVSRTLIGMDGAGRGLLALAEEPGLEAADLQPIPQDALAALAFRLDPDKLLGTVLDIAQQIEPRAGEQIQQGLMEIQQELGFQLREDLLQSLGDVWTISAGEREGGLVSGWVATVQLRDRDALERVHGQLLQMAAQVRAHDNRAPEIRTSTIGEQTVHTLIIPDDDFPLNPAWCLTETHLVVTLFPQALKSYLARSADAGSLAAERPVARLLAADPPPLKLAYADTQKIFRLVYPLVQVGAQFGFSAIRRQGALDLDPFMLPSPSAIDPHLLPSVLAVRRTEAGIEVYSHQSTPGVSLGSSVPVMVGLLLPAVQSARQAARRTSSMNNMKQIGLALHNYHDTYRGFPASSNADANGKPLLSWRVHILPFVEAAALYDQFHLDEPWDSAHNRKLIAQMPPVYQAPGSNADPGKTVYLGIRGEDKVFVTPKKQHEGRFLPVGEGMARITDGTSNTVMVVEASDTEAVIWSKPDDFEPSEDAPGRGLVGLRPGGFNALFCDGSVRFLSVTIDAQTLKNLFTKNDGQVINLP